MPDSNLAVHELYQRPEANPYNDISHSAGITACVNHGTASTPFVLALRAAGAAR